MGGSIKLFTVRGIAVRLHTTFALILVWAAIQYGWLEKGGVRGALWGVLVIGLIFVCVLLHEFGHALTAQRFGIATHDITLWPFGGLASLERIPERPLQEFAIAIAGPLVNIVIAIVLLLVGGATLLSSGLNFRAIQAALSTYSLPGLWSYLFLANLLLAVFNLVPAFPMDGGRVLRAILALWLPYARATLLAVGVGQSFAMLMGLFGVLRGDFVLLIIAVFIYLGAQQEGALVRVKSVLASLTVRRAYSTRAQSLAPTDKLQRAVDLTLSSFQADFPVCAGNELTGLLTRTDLLQALNNHGPETAVVDVMRREFSTARLDEELFAVQQRMREGGLEAIPVVDEAGFRGLLTLRDIDEVYRLLSVSPQLLDLQEAGP